VQSLQLSPAGRARAELLAGPHRQDREIARAADCHKVTVGRARRQLEAEGLIPVRGRPRPPDWHAPALPVMPPELADGLCTRHPEPDLWSSREPADRAVALRVCRACPVLAVCASWSLSLPASDSTVWGGLTAGQRRPIRHRRRRQVKAGPA
jgi:hypothetical protein